MQLSKVLQKKTGKDLVFKIIPKDELKKKKKKELEK